MGEKPSSSPGWRKVLQSGILRPKNRSGESVPDATKKAGARETRGPVDDLSFDSKLKSGTAKGVVPKRGLRGSKSV